MSEAEIIESVVSGKLNNFTFIVETYQPMVFRTCMGFVHNKEDADDLTQDVFISAYQSLKSFKGKSSFSTWLYRIAINASLNFVRNNSKRSIIQRFETFFGTNTSKEILISISDKENPEELIISEEHHKIVQDALNTLPESQRTAIVLSKYDELPQKEIAQIMNITEGAVEALIQRAKVNLREKLWEYFKINRRKKTKPVSN